MGVGHRPHRGVRLGMAREKEMNREDYIRIAGECGAFVEIATPEFLDFIVRYGEAVAVAVREKCAEVDDE